VKIAFKDFIQGCIFGLVFFIVYYMLFHISAIYNDIQQEYKQAGNVNIETAQAKNTVPIQVTDESEESIDESVYLSEFIKYRNYKVDDKLVELIINATIQYGKEYDVPYKLLIFVMDVESDFRPDVVSKAGAIGLMQIMPKVWLDKDNKNKLQNIGITKTKQLYDPELNIKAGSYILSLYIKQCNNDYSCALKKYFGGSYKSYYNKVVYSAGEYFFFKNKKM